MDRKNVATKCACGAVAVYISGTPQRQMLCACKDCQKATGTGHSALALFGNGQITITGKTRSFSVTAESGSTVSRFFCPECGTPLYGETSRMPQHKLLPAALLDGLTYAPRSMIFARSQQDWDIVSSAITRYEKYKEAS